MTPNDILLYSKISALSNHREISSGSRLEHMQGLPAKHCMERESQWDVYTKFLPSGNPADKEAEIV